VESVVLAVTGVFMESLGLWLKQRGWVRTVTEGRRRSGGGSVAVGRYDAWEATGGGSNPQTRRTGV